jgi:CheY-like chemotaxis protein
VEAQLAQAQKMEAVGQLTGGIAHDFNNLLLAIGLTLETVEEEDAGTGSSLRPIIEGAKHATEQARTLVAQLLAFGRRQALNPNSFDVNDSVIESTRMLRRALDANITIETVLSQELWPAFADRNQFETALLNLAINARDAMGAGGRLLIETANGTLNDDYSAAHPDVSPGEYVTVSVSDTGCGMPPEILSRVFEPFFTTKPLGEGTGLGLSQVYGFMKQSGGHVWLYSEPGHGTRATLYLPRTAAVNATTIASAKQNVGTSRGEQILLVEDNKVVRDAVARVLGGLGYRVFEAMTGDEALDIVKSDTPIDLLFTDMVLPGPLNGNRLAVEARQLRPGLRVLLTSGYSQSLIQGTVAGLEPVEVISKPYATAELASRIRAMLRVPTPDAEPRSTGC